MAFSFNPTGAESTTLAQIAQRESGGNYTATISPANCAAMGYTVCTASGAYMFTDSTWQSVAAQTGVGTQYATAADAPAWMQDTNALWLLQKYGPNASQSWAATGPYDTSGLNMIPGSSTQPLIDLSGSAATTSSSDILSSLDASAASVGIDLTNPMTDVMLAAAAAVAIYFAIRR